MFRKVLSTNSEPIWKPTEHFETKMPAICNRLKTWMAEAVGGDPLPSAFESASAQGVLVENLFYRDQ